MRAVKAVETEYGQGACLTMRVRSLPDEGLLDREDWKTVDGAVMMAVKLVDKIVDADTYRDGRIVLHFDSGCNPTTAIATAAVIIEDVAEVACLDQWQFDGGHWNDVE